MLDTPEPDLAYLFKHVVTQEVAYSLLLYAQRRQLHRAVAEWYEQTQADDLSALYPLLAYHWGRAEEPTKTLAYLELAGEQALRAGAYQEAVDFLTDAASLAESRPARPRGAATGPLAPPARRRLHGAGPTAREPPARRPCGGPAGLAGAATPLRLLGDLASRRCSKASTGYGRGGSSRRPSRPHGALEAARAYERLAIPQLLRERQRAGRQCRAPSGQPGRAGWAIAGAGARLRVDERGRGCRPAPRPGQEAMPRGRARSPAKLMIFPRLPSCWSRPAPMTSAWGTGRRRGRAS